MECFSPRSIICSSKNYSPSTPNVNFSRLLLESQTPERDVRLEETAEIQFTSTPNVNPAEILRLVSKR